MKVRVKSPGSATVINAIAIGSGSAFGIDLNITSEAKFSNKGIDCSSDLGVDPKLMNICVKNILNHYNLISEDFKSNNDLIENFIFENGQGIQVKTESNLPLGSGLSSSSALSNAVTLSVSKLIANAFSLSNLSDLEIINLAIDSSLEAGVTITGAFDDATASYFGGITVTDNINRKILIQEKMEEHDVLVFMPDKESLSGSSDVNRMKLLSSLVETAFEKAYKKDYYNALNLNGLLYGTTLGFNNEIAIEALNAGAIASGLSGTGSSFVAIVDENSIDAVENAWSSFEGNVIRTKVNNEGTKVI